MKIHYLAVIGFLITAPLQECFGSQTTYGINDLLKESKDPYRHTEMLEGIRLLQSRTQDSNKHIQTLEKIMTPNMEGNSIFQTCKQIPHVWLDVNTYDERVETIKNLFRKDNQEWYSDNYSGICFFIGDLPPDDTFKKRIQTILFLTEKMTIGNRIAEICRGVRNLSNDGLDYLFIKKDLLKFEKTGYRYIEAFFDYFNDHDPNQKLLDVWFEQITALQNERKLLLSDELTIQLFPLVAAQGNLLNIFDSVQLKTGSTYEDMLFVFLFPSSDSFQKSLKSNCFYDEHKNQNLIFIYRESSLKTKIIDGLNSINPSLVRLYRRVLQYEIPFNESPLRELINYPLKDFLEKKGEEKIDYHSLSLKMPRHLFDFEETGKKNLQINPLFSFIPDEKEPLKEGARTTILHQCIKDFLNDGNNHFYEIVRGLVEGLKYRESIFQAKYVIQRTLLKAFNLQSIIRDSEYPDRIHPTFLTLSKDFILEKFFECLTPVQIVEKFRQNINILLRGVESLNNHSLIESKKLLKDLNPMRERMDIGNYYFEEIESAKMLLEMGFLKEAEERIDIKEN